MVSKFHRKDEITKQFYRKITSCRQKRKTYPLVICCITIENKPFSLLIYLFKMVILYSKLWVYHRVNTNLLGGFDLFSIRRSGSSCLIPGKWEQFGTTRNPLFQSALSTDKVPHGTPKSGYIWLIYIFFPQNSENFCIVSLQSLSSGARIEGETVLNAIYGTVDARDVFTTSLQSSRVSQTHK